MKQKFTLEIECLDSIKNSLEGEFLDEILNAFKIGLIEKFGGWQGQNFSLKASQIVENEQLTAYKPLVLKGLDWSNRNEGEDQDSYGGPYKEERVIER